MTHIPDEAVQAACEVIRAHDTEQWGEDGGNEMYCELVTNMLTAALPHLALSTAPCSVEVKKLEWGETSYGMPEVFTEVGVYRINHAHDGGWSLNRNNKAIADHDGRRNFADQQNVKAAAQADFERCILSNVVTKKESSIDTQIADYVIDFFVTHGMIDESEEYSLQDIMAALHDNYEPTKPVDVAAVRRQAFEEAKAIAFDTSENGQYMGNGDCSGHSIYQQGATEVYDALCDVISDISPAEPAKSDHIANAGKMVEPLTEMKVLEYIFGKHDGWDDVLSKKLTPPLPLPIHLYHQGLDRKPMTHEEIHAAICDVEKELDSLGRRSWWQRAIDWMKS